MSARHLWMLMATALSFGASSVIAAAECDASASSWPVFSIERDGARIHIVGTIHLMTPDAQWLSPRIESLLDEADTLWLELPDLDGPVSTDDFESLIYVADGTLFDLLEKEQLAALYQLLARQGVPQVEFEALQPWYASVELETLAMADGAYLPETGIDMVLLEMARERGLAVDGFETAENQLMLIAGLPIEEQLVMLMDAVEGFDDTLPEIDRWVEDLLVGDLGSVEVAQASIEAETPVFYQSVIVDRNGVFADGIEGILEEGGTAFVAIGLAHLVGRDSVIDMLEARGIAVTRLD